MYKTLMALAKKLGAEVEENAPMSKYTSFKAGGTANLLITPVSVSSLREIILFCKENEIRYFILGNGSNVLVRDEGFDGAVIHLGAALSKITLKDENTIVAEAGASLKSICMFALEHSLTGLEFAYGIPGTLGGAVYMNAGAYDSEISNIITECKCISADGKFETLALDKMKLGYRTSIFKEKKNRVITSAKFLLSPGDKETIRNRMDELMQRRKSKQPLEYPSAGSTFKRPTGNFAGTLIEMCGLKGFTVGGAQVSEKHAGFVVNLGGATASDVKRVIEGVTEKVFLETSVKLEPEVEFIGR